MHHNSAFGNPSCTTIGSTNAAPGTASIAATYQPTCTMSANALNFGSIASTSSATGGSSSLTTRCSASTPYTISLNGGLSGASNPAQRLMTHGADQLVYGLYQDSNHAQVWGATPGANVLAGSGTGSTLAVPVFGLIPSQITPPIGTYTDTVIVTLQY